MLRSANPISGTIPTTVPAERGLSIPQRILGMDLRSLAAFRVASATIVVLDLIFRLQYLTAFYTDQGILPRFARILLFEEVDPSGYRHAWSLHMLSGEWWPQCIMIGVAMLFAVWMAMGYRTRLSTFATWLLLVSLDSRNPLLMDGGDSLHRGLLFWSIFLPLGGCWSLDSLLRPTETESPRHVSSLATIAVLLQICAMYWFAVYFKTHPTWLQDFSAVYYALSNDIFTTPLGHSLLAYPNLLKVLTVATYVLELVGPCLLLVPFGNARLRIFVALSFWLLHAVFGLCLDIGLFVPISMIGWISVLPPEFWNGLAHGPRALWARIGEPRKTRAVAKLRSWFPNPERPRYTLRLSSQLVLVMMIAYTFAWNLRETDIRYWEPRILSRSWNLIGRATGLDQRWSMFAPIPSSDDGWYVMQGTLRDGSVVNLWQPGRELPWKKPDNVCATYVSQRWRKYLDTLKHDEYSLAREYFVNWLRRRWNETHARDAKDREVVDVEVYFQLEETAPPGMGDFPPTTVDLWKWRYE